MYSGMLCSCLTKEYILCNTFTMRVSLQFEIPFGIIIFVITFNPKILNFKDICNWDWTSDLPTGSCPIWKCKQGYAHSQKMPKNEIVICEDSLAQRPSRDHWVAPAMYCRLISE